MEVNKIYNENCIDTTGRIPDSSIDCVVTSPPYFGLRDYGDDNQFGLEETPEAFVKNLVDLFREIRRALKDTGTVWLVIGDSYASNGVYLDSWSKRHPDKKHLHTTNKERYGGDRKGVRGGIYNIKAKDLIGIPWRVAFALQADGWYLRQDIIWHKPNPMPESVTDRCTKSHEYIFLLTKSQRYFYDAEAVKEKAAINESRPAGVVRNREYDYNSKENTYPEAYKKRPRQFGASKQEGTMRNDEGNMFVDNGFRNKRSVWTVTTKPYKEAHFATYPEALIVPCIKAGCPEGGIVYDPFMGSGTTALVSHKLNRNWIGSELNKGYVKIAEDRLKPHLSQFKLNM